jgi:hypothetical protein
MRLFTRGWARGPLTALALCLPGAGPAAAQAPQAGEPIVVTGDREARPDVGVFVDRHLRETRNGQLARWHEPVCVRTWGLPLDFNAAISNRVMDMAERIGARTNRAELCRPNVRIGFTDDPQRIIDLVAGEHEIILGFHYAAQHARLTRIVFPVQAWYATTTRTQGGDERLDEVRARAPGSGSNSRISSGISSGLAHVLILVDTRVVTGHETETIADLIAFLALAQSTLAAGCEPTLTILNVLNQACPAERRLSAMSRQDVAFLRALYSISPELQPQSQRSALAARIHRELDSE